MGDFPTCDDFGSSVSLWSLYGSVFFFLFAVTSCDERVVCMNLCVCLSTRLNNVHEIQHLLWVVFILCASQNND